MNANAVMHTELATVKPGKADLRRCRLSQSGRSAFVLIGQGLAIVALFLGSYFFFSHYVVQTVRVSGTSMLPNLQEADIYVVNRLTALFRAPSHGDIVVLKDPTDKTYAVKRVVGVEGDTVELRDGNVFLNSQRLVEPYLRKGTQTFPFDSLTQVVRCGPGQFFVLGDNRFYSSDSRCYGAVSRSAVLGFVVR